MPLLSKEGLRTVENIAQNTGFSTQAVTHMLFALKNGNSSMAQFNHPDFGGSGQWMQGGMIMLGDMFNNNLKSRVDYLCQTLVAAINSQPNTATTNNSQSGLFIPDPQQEWWPPELGTPNATGSQNNVRYAYFANLRRLAVDTGGVWVYDTQDHRIGGFSQQQGSTGGIVFTSQYGTVDLSTLPVVYRNGKPVTPQNTNFTTNMEDLGTNSKSEGKTDSQTADIFSAIERLGALKTKGILTDHEFTTKKAELLRRL
ncbi:hypothetical protein TI04_00870 [Achromatium sp. WMS2]|nr:hypothetical protein TI04_00870 [Achromatium sp. WMS2]